MGPLHGLRVIEMAGIGPVPFAAMMLADMGAEVMRIERRGRAGGDPFSEVKGGGFMARGRRIVALDLKTPGAVATLLKLIGRADVLLEGFRPGVMERLGLGPEPCHGVNPRLVYGRATGWGQSGPYAQAAGHDINFIALTGTLHAIGTREAPAVPLNVIGDFGGGGMLVGLGVLAAVIEAGRSGRGQVVDAAMTDGAALLTASQYAFRSLGFWSDRRGDNLVDGGAPFYGVYECADGKFIAVGAIEQPFHDKLIDGLGLDRAAFASRWDKVEWPRLRRLLAERFMTRARDAWCAAFAGIDACVTPVLDFDEAPLHPQNAARGTFATAGGVVQPAPAPRFSRTAAELPGSPSAGPEASAAALADWGISAREIDALRKSGAI